MANGTVFDRALEISTPGFDSLLQTIQQETNRIERNKELARQRKERIELAQLESNLALSNQVIMQEERHRDAVERMKLQNKFALDQLESEKNAQDLQQRQEQFEDLFEQREKARKEALTQQEKLLNEYSDVYQLGIIPDPFVDTRLHESGFFGNVVTDESGRQLGTIQEYRQISSDLKPLAGFMRKLQNPSKLVETKDRENIKRKNTTFITRSNASAMRKRIENMTLQEKREFSNRLQGEVAFDVATFGMFGDAPEVREEEEEGGPEYNTEAARSFRSQYVMLNKDNGGAVRLPAEISRAQGLPMDVPVLGKNMEEIRQLDKVIFDYATENYMEQDEDSGEWIPNENLDEQGELTLKALEQTGSIVSAFETFLHTKAEFPGASPDDFILRDDWNPNEGLGSAWKAQEKTISVQERSVDPDYEAAVKLTGEINFN